MRRRDLLRGTAAALQAKLLLTAPPVDAAAAGPTRSGAVGSPFDSATVRTLAHKLAQQPYKPPDDTLPDWLKKIDYQDYRSIRFDPAHALWRGQGLNFTVEFFHRGFLYKDRVDINIVTDGKATPVLYSPDLFSFGKVKPTGTDDLGFAGFRIHYPINRPDYFDEICAFLGASYFRGVAKGQGYGLSARGLAIKTADPSGEEFPLFKTFWIERPPKGSTSIVVHALLDSVSAAGAFRFTIRPGEATVFDTEAALYPRVDITQSGIAPMTSMFWFDTNDRTGIDDYRAAVHDSDGLAMATGRGEQLWRPLANPHTLQISAFSDVNPRGFGLMQRKRAFADYQDLEARYEKRPSLWVEPIGDWGTGIVELVEIPTQIEIHDNIVSFWRPKDPLKAKGEYLLNYRLHWCAFAPGQPKTARISQTRAGLGWDRKSRLFIVDADGDTLKSLAPGTQPALVVSADKGSIQNPVAEPNPPLGGWRMSFELSPGNNKLVELTAKLTDGDKPLTETWLYRWTP